MAEETGAFVELGLIGLDKVAEKYHHKFPGRFGRRKKIKKQLRTHSEPRVLRDREDSDSESDDDDHRSMYVPDSDRDRDRDKREDRDRDASYASRAGDTGGGVYYPASSASDRAVLRGGGRAYGYLGGYQAAPRGPSPAPRVAPRPETSKYDGYEPYPRGRALPSRRRSFSHSPPRHSHRLRFHSPSRQRVRSKSPSHHRATATIVGALTGGFLGNQVNKGSTLMTIAGAVVGGLGAREAEKAYDRRKDREFEEEERREERRHRKRDSY
ncbi:uncharacterized protein BDR25DRAFT_306730 [Lindgomyces ingoldianus]|uniref:Uncharacterized protein n=1 Tax=Lindgomyces ingoldianus TaxID=673940 RepID=A0ACB6QEC0_9PLEO|nr:uncharacterized protein BDR25DRAFT_306730 [Lindgomyces ingoldianus]KAF2465264.1 hypothetical protein BDR25DRAFT_306730 [Lindgomyces ingoldianus]